MTRSFVTLGLLILLAGATVSAQERLEANVPFDFKVGDRAFAAGKYIVDHSKSTGGTVVMIQSENHSNSIMVLTNAVQTNGPSSAGKLVFKRYGDTHFLSQIWRPGYDQGRQLLTSRAEREIASAPRPSGVQMAAVPLSTR